MHTPTRSPDSPPKPSLQELALAYQQERSAADFEDLVRAYSGPIRRFLCNTLGDTHLAEDVLQETWLRVLTRIDQYDASRPFEAWVYALANNRAIDFQRSRARHPTVSMDASYQDAAGSESEGSLASILLDSSPDPSTLLEARGRADWMRNAIAQLSPKLQGPLLDVYYHDQSYRQVAERHGIPIGTVKSRLHAALMQIQSLGE